jgi:predicted aspartyl protease
MESREPRVTGKIALQQITFVVDTGATLSLLTS